MVRMIAASVGRTVRFVHVPIALAYLSTLLAGWIVKDAVLTREEYRGLMDNLLSPEGPSTGGTRLSEWMLGNAGGLGREYASEVGRHYAKQTLNHRGHRGSTGMLEGL
jgi:NADH dehydrogenase